MSHESDHDLDAELAQQLRRQSLPAFPAAFTENVVARHLTRRSAYRRTVLSLRLVGGVAVALSTAGVLTITPLASVATTLAVIWHAAVSTHAAAALLLGAIAAFLSARLAPRQLRDAT